MKWKSVSKLAALVAVLMVVTGPARACGPFFPNNLLDCGDPALLQPPFADFRRELERLKLAPGKLTAVPLEKNQTFSQQTDTAELADLTAALRAKKVPREEATAIISFHLSQRAKLTAYLAQLEQYQTDRTWQTDTNGENGHWESPTNPPPSFPDIAPAPGLPLEFADYFQGVIDWRQGDDGKALQHWNALLDLPPAERHYKSTWAAFMCGKLNLSDTNDYAQGWASNYFQQVRDLAAGGFADPLGLAVASLGLQAQIELRRGQYQPAMDHYLQQYAAGDDSAVESLRTTASRALNGTDTAPEQFAALARDARARRVVNAYLITLGAVSRLRTEDTRTNALAGRAAWLAAVEAAGVRDDDSAAQLALAAYQANDMAAAERWCALAANDPVVLWVKAKLDLRAGQIDPAAKILAKLCRKFPVERNTNRPAGSLGDSLWLSLDYEDEADVTAGQQVAGELGVLRLARREYAEALDTLLRSGYWMDAAYVAEQVLTADELKKYVDRHWPAGHSVREDILAPGDFRGEDGGISTGSNVRYLLARRLARLGRYAEAQPYYPAKWRPALTAFAAGLKMGADTNCPPAERAAALFASACLARTNGMELLGTELEPDWAIYDGAYELDRLSKVRRAGHRDWSGDGAVAGPNLDAGVALAQNGDTNAPLDRVNRASADELARAAASHTEPDKRFHYRYQAAQLAARAAALLPDDNDAAAKMLWAAGTWLKYRDPKAADLYYKLLVRRCPHTAIGAAADKMRWFPLLDENGQPKPWKPPVGETNSP